MHCNQRHVVNSLISSAQLGDYFSLVETNGIDSKSVFWVIIRLRHRDKRSHLAGHNGAGRLAALFSEFFSFLQTISNSIAPPETAAVTDPR